MTLRLFAGAAALATLTATSGAQTTCTQSVDNMTIAAANTIACTTQMPQNHTDNAYLRRYSGSTNCGSSSGLSISGVTFAVENATAGAAAGGQQPVEIRLYTIAPGDPLVYANMTMVHQETFMVIDQAQALVTVTLNSVVSIPANQDVAVELFLPDGTVDGHLLFVGSNTLGESSPSYIAAPGCGIAEPSDLSALGATLNPPIPDIHLILDLVLAGDVGTNYCTAAVNATGVPGDISGSGSPAVATNSFTVTASNIPANQFGIFVTSMTQGFVPGAGGTSNGNLCLAGQIGRFFDPTQILNSGSNGSFSLQLPLNQFPQGTGFVAVMPGETWFFQAWHREPVGAGSNFTNGLEVTFQ